MNPLTLDKLFTCLHSDVCKKTLKLMVTAVLMEVVVVVVGFQMVLGAEGPLCVILSQPD